MTVPCESCPWRRDSNLDAIPHFNLDKARNLRNTVGRGDDFRNVMACHQSTEGNDIACIGYLGREGSSNLNVRMMALDGKVDLGGAFDAAQRLNLHACFDEMLERIETHFQGDQ